MTDQRKDDMPEEIYVFGDPCSIGDLGFTVTRPKEGHIKYVRADISPPVPDDVALRHVIDRMRDTITWLNAAGLTVAAEDAETLIRAASTPSAVAPYMPTSEEFIQHLSVLWKEYAECADDRLSLDGQKLKKALIKICTPSAEVRALRDAIDDVWPILQGGMTLSGLSHTAVGKIMDTLDAVLEKGE